MPGMLGSSNSVLKYDGSTNIIPIAAEVTVYTKSFMLRWATYFGVWLKADSTLGTPNLMIELEESYIPPTTEGSAETGLWVEPDGFANVFDAVADKLAHIKTITPVPMMYGRYKITGLTGNPSDTTITIENFFQEMV